MRTICTCNQEMYVLIWIYTHVYIYIHIYAHSCTHKHKHTHTHIYIGCTTRPLSRNPNVEVHKRMRSTVFAQKFLYRDSADSGGSQPRNDRTYSNSKEAALHTCMYLINIALSFQHCCLGNTTCRIRLTYIHIVFKTLTYIHIVFKSHKSVVTHHNCTMVVLTESRVGAALEVRI